MQIQALPVTVVAGIRRNLPADRGQFPDAAYGSALVVRLRFEQTENCRNHADSNRVPVDLLTAFFWQTYRQCSQPCLSQYVSVRRWSHS